MTALAVVFACFALSLALALRLGRVIRSNTRTPNRPVRGPHTPARARQTRSHRR